MIVIAPTGNPVDTARALEREGFEIGIGSEGKYLTAYPTTIPVNAA